MEANNKQKSRISSAEVVRDSDAVISSVRGKVLKSRSEWEVGGQGESATAQYIGRGRCAGRGLTGGHRTLLHEMAKWSEVWGMYKLSSPKHP